MKHTTILMALALVLAACAAPVTPAPTSTSVPTVVPSVAPTIAPSSTLEPTPSPTPTPSRTPEPTPTPTLGFIFILPTPTVGTTPSPSAPLACQVIAQSIVDGTEFHPREPFSNDWLLSNTGSAPWLPGNVDFAYIGGTKMNLSTVVQLRQNVNPGNTIALNVDMRAPSKPSDYTTFWSLRRGTDYFCRVKLTISVVLP